MKINEVAKLTGITVRTLHYYDEIGLLRPSKITEAGYRLYEDEALETLQQILFFRELDFPLSEIKKILTNSAFDKSEALHKHRELLAKKRDRLDGLINLVNDTIKGEKTMSFKEFDRTEIENCKEQYAAEVKERWGETEAFAQSEEKTSGYDSQKWKGLNDEGNDLLKAFATVSNHSPDSEAAQVLVQKWQAYITANFYDCTTEILSGLGLMYVNDARFQENIDKNGKGTADFMAKSIAYFCGNQAYAKCCDTIDG